jgi:anti-sigma regulatory factor (Ser/Thr protein kinase)
MTNTKAASPLAAPAPDAGSPASADAIRSFPGLPESVSAARSWAAGFFPDPATAADAALMTSELVTNAILYSASRLPGGQVTVSVGSAGGALRVDVLDQGEIAPRIAGPCGLGLGLALVEALSDASGADGRDRWFELRAGGA